MIRSPKFPADDEFALEEEFELVAEVDGPVEPVEDLMEDLGIEPEKAALLPLMDVLPADFPLPVLARFVPDVRLKAEIDEATRYALAVDVRGTEGLQAADLALTALRTSLKGITEHFAEPVRIAHELHKRLTGLRGEWAGGAEDAVKVVGRKVYAEQKRLEAIAEEERRKVQAEADRLAREEALKRAKEAERDKAPVAIVKALEREAETAKAAPVYAGPTTAPLKGNTVAKNWTCTLAGTPREDEQHPDVSELSAGQIAAFMNLITAVVSLQAPLACVTPNWSYLKKRAKADERAFAIPGLEAYDAGTIRAKSSRRG